MATFIKLSSTGLGDPVWVNAELITSLHHVVSVDMQHISTKLYEVGSVEFVHNVRETPEQIIALIKVS